MLYFRRSSFVGGLASLAVVLALASGTVEAQTRPFKITGGGIAETGLPLPGQPAREHWSVGNATGLGRYEGIGSVKTDSADFSKLESEGIITGEFGGGSPYTFVGANGDELVCFYGSTENGAAAPGTFTLTVVGQTAGGDLIVEAEFFAEFVVQTELCTGKWAGVTGSWFMTAHTDPFVLGSMDATAYTWHGEGKLKFPNKKRR